MNGVRESLRLLVAGRYWLHSFWLGIAVGIVAITGMLFATRQPSTTALDAGLSLARIGLPLLTILAVQELFSREFDKKFYLNSLCYPASRSRWLFGRMLAVIIYALATLLYVSIPIIGVVLYAPSIYQQATPVGLSTPFFVTLIFLALDLIVTALISIFLALVSRTPSFVLVGTLGFIIVARSYTPIIELLREAPDVVSKFADPRLYQDSLGLLAFILPDLGRLDVRMIALYNDMTFLPHDWPLLVFSILTYAVALIGLSIWVLNKREFN